MAWAAAVDFTDIVTGINYRAGDKYPRPGSKSVSKARLEELSTARNRMGFPLIAAVPKTKKSTRKSGDSDD